MTHEQIRRKIEQLQKMLEEPETGQKAEPTYRTIIVNRKKDILRKYVPEVHYLFLQNEVSQLVSSIFYAILESKGINRNKQKIFSVLFESKEHEDLYFEIYESICKCISQYVIDIKPFKSIKSNKEDKKLAETGILEKISDHEYKCSVCGKHIDCDKKFLKEIPIYRCWNCKASFLNTDSFLSD